MRDTFPRLALILAAIVAAMVPATAEAAQPVFRVRSIMAALAPSAGDDWQRLDPGTYRTRDPLAVARAAAGDGPNGAWHVSHADEGPGAPGLFEVALPSSAPVETYYAEVRARFADAFPAIVAVAFMGDLNGESYLFIETRSTVWMRGSALDFYSFQRVERE